MALIITPDYPVLHPSYPSSPEKLRVDLPGRESQWCTS